MNFNEICIFQVKPDKSEIFENLIVEMKEFFETYENLLYFKFTKRTHRLENVSEGTPPKELVRIIKSIKYLLFLEFKDEKIYGKFIKEFFEKFDKKISKCVLMPADIFIGKEI
jgi:hypothetical protein